MFLLVSKFKIIGMLLNVVHSEVKTKNSSKHTLFRTAVLLFVFQGVGRDEKKVRGGDDGTGKEQAFCLVLVQL